MGRAYFGKEPQEGPPQPPLSPLGRGMEGGIPRTVIGFNAFVLIELGNNGRTLVEKRFSWEETARRVESVLRGALGVNSKN